jgi:carbon-monoxide dehydrogenase medium subunit
MKLRLSTPSALVDIGRIPGLGDVVRDGGRLRIGALATHAAVAQSALVREACPVLAETAAVIGDPQVRNRGTFGGSIAHADPGADYPTVLKALGAGITLVGRGGEHEVAADDFFLGIFTTAAGPGELVTSAAVPAAQPGSGAAYLKHAHPASGYAVVGVAAAVSVEAGTCTRATVTVGGVAPAPVHATGASDLLAGASPSAETIAAAAQAVPESLDEPMGDAYASGEYRVHLASVLARRALTAAFERAM